MNRWEKTVHAAHSPHNTHIIQIYSPNRTLNRATFAHRVVALHLPIEWKNDASDENIFEENIIICLILEF